MSYDYDDDVPLANQAEVYCEECNEVFIAYGTHTPATLEEPGEFNTDDTLCEECKEKQEFMDSTMQTAFILTPNGRINAAPKGLEASGAFTLKQLQKIVGGYIEIVRIPTEDEYGSMVMVLNEEGKLKSLPVNLPASMLSGLMPHDQIVGTVLICSASLVE